MAIIVSNMSVVIPAIFRALGVGDLFMREDTVDMDFSTMKMARTTTSSTRIELGLPKTPTTTVTNGDGTEGEIGMAVFRQRDSADFGTREDHKHRLTAQASDMSLGSSRMKVVLLVDESDVVDSLGRVGSLPQVDGGQDAGRTGAGSTSP